MIDLDSSFQQVLSAWLLEHQGEPAGVRIIVIDGRRCVIKRRRDTLKTRLVYCLRYIRSSTLAWLCLITLGELPSARVLLRNSLDDEAQRLAKLRAAGCRVPLILRHEPGVLVLEYVGQDVPYLLRTRAQGERLALVTNVAQDLAAFHRAGFVHGGAQLRNVMFKDGALTRIDFEENIGEALSHPVGQAYDVYQMISSMAGLRGHEFSRHNRQALCDRLLSAYRNANPDPLVDHQLKRMARALGVLYKLLGGVLKRFPGRDVQGVVHVANTFRL